MESEEYIAEVMPGGYLSISGNVAKDIALNPHSGVRII